MNTAPQPPKCPYCDAIHQGKCSLVKSFEYHADGTLKRVEFHAPTNPFTEKSLFEQVFGR